MEKTKRSKKRYAWTDKFNRKAKSRYSCNWPGAPKDFRKPYWGSHRSQEKTGIYKCIAGFEDYFFPYHHKHSARWDWY